MTIFGQHIPVENITNLLLAGGGLLGGTITTVAKIIHPYHGGILFGMAVISYSLATYASILHIRNIKKNGKH